VRNAADPKQVRGQRKQLELDRQFADNCWRNVVATVEGRKVLYDILKSAKVIQPAWHEVRDSSTAMTFAAGQQSIGAAIQARLEGLAVGNYTAILADADVRRREKQERDKSREIDRERKQPKEPQEEPSTEDDNVEP
jgi:hypothetical protein